jgi:hypothetical protein
MFSPRRFYHRPTDTTILESDLADMTVSHDVIAAFERALDLLISEAKIFWLSPSEIAAILSDRTKHLQAECIEPSAA